MSADNETAAPPASSGFGIWTLLRIAGIAIGIVSMTILAWKGFDFRLDPFFRTVLQLVEEWAGNVVRPLELLVVEPVLRLLRAYGWNLALQPHWKHSFVLTWLMFAAMARTATAAGNRGSALFIAVCGGSIALVTGIATGCFDLRSVAVLLVPLIGLSSFVVCLHAWNATFRRKSGSWFADFRRRGALLLIGAIIALILALIGVVPIAWEAFPFIPKLDSPGLGLLFAFVFVLSVIGLLHGLTRGSEFLAAWSTRVALDLLSVMLGAIGIVAINQLLT